jgi:hypothetical protein
LYRKPSIQEGREMARKRYTAEQIIRHLRQAEALSSQGRRESEIYFRL